MTEQKTIDNTALRTATNFASSKEESSKTPIKDKMQLVQDEKDFPVLMERLVFLDRMQGDTIDLEIMEESNLFNKRDESSFI